MEDAKVNQTPDREDFSSHFSSQAEGKSCQPGSEVVTVGEAAKLIGVSPTTVQRLCKLWEANPNTVPPVGLPFAWTSPLAGRRDIHDRPLRGKRRIVRSAVLAFRDARVADLGEGDARLETLAERARRVETEARRLGLDTRGIAATVVAMLDARTAADGAERTIRSWLRETERAIREARQDQDG